MAAGTSTPGVVSMGDIIGGSPRCLFSPQNFRSAGANFSFGRFDGAETIAETIAQEGDEMANASEFSHTQCLHPMRFRIRHHLSAISDVCSYPSVLQAVSETLAIVNIWLLGSYLLFINTCTMFEIRTTKMFLYFGESVSATLKIKG